jgi:hypothetical protein
MGGSLQRVRDLLVRENRAMQNAVTMSAKIPKGDQSKKKSSTPVNAVEKRPRGRPRGNRQADSDAGVLLRAENYRRDLSSRWDDLMPGLVQARDAADTDEGVKTIMEAWLAAGFADGSHGFPYLLVLAPRILRVLRDKKCPKQREDRITFLADALSGFQLAPRTAHELCQREREKRRAGNAIIQWVPVFDVECSCGYRGQSVYGACPACGAVVPPSRP